MEEQVLKLFLNSENFHSKDRYYDDYVGEVKFFFQKPQKNRFHPLLGLTNDNKIIPNTNSFLVDSCFYSQPFNPRDSIVEYDKKHKIFTRIYETYCEIISAKESLTIEEDMFLLVNPFSGSNIGHDLSIVFDRINTYINRGYKCKIAIGSIETNTFYEKVFRVCKILLPDAEFFIIPKEKHLTFKKLIVTRNIIFDILLYEKTLIKEVIQSVIRQQNEEKINKFKNKKVLIFKNTNQDQIIENQTSFCASKTIKKLVEDYDYVEINPEKTDFDEIVLSLFYAEKIITSTGAISYGNAIFFNPNIRYIFLRSEPYLFPHYHGERYKIIDVPKNMDEFYEKNSFIIANG